MDLTNSRAVVLAEDDYQELEIWYPVLRFRERGVAVDVIAPNADGNYRSALGYPLMPNGGIADSGEADIVVVPGCGAAKRLADDPNVAKLVANAHQRAAVIAAIGAGIGVVESAGVARDAERVVTIQDANELPDLMNGVWHALEDMRR